MVNKRIDLTQEQFEVLEGLMLGDGAAHGGVNAHLSVFRAKKDKQYLEYERKIFQNYLNPSYKKSCLYIKGHIDKRTGKRYPGYHFATSVNPSLTDVRSRWYPNEKKIVPRDLVLSSRTMAHWICDDGCIWANKKETLPYRFMLDLATHSFSFEDVEFLVFLLESKYDEKFNIQMDFKDEAKTIPMFFIRTYDNAIRKIIKDVDPYFKMQRKRKWDLYKSRYYNDHPEKQRTNKPGMSVLYEKLETLFRIYDNMSLLDIARHMNFIYKGIIDFERTDKFINDANNLDLYKDLYFKTINPITHEVNYHATRAIQLKIKPKKAK